MNALKVPDSEHRERLSSFSDAHQSYSHSAIHSSLPSIFPGHQEEILIYYMKVAMS